MKQKTFHYSGGAGIIALLVAIGFAGVQFLSLSQIQDPALKEDLQLRLAGRQQLSFEDKLELAKAKGDFTDLAAEADTLQEPVHIHSISGSSPLLSWSNKKEVIVRVEYSPHSGVKSPRKLAYVKYYKRALGSWEYRSMSSTVSYYMNFF